MSKNLLRLQVLLSVFCAVAYTQTGGSISGTILDEAGAAVPGAQVVIQKLTAFTRTADGHAAVAQAGFNTSLIADSGGRFSLAGLAAGTYHVCGYGSAASQVSSCDWTGVATVKLQPGQALTGIARTVANGVVVTINVADPHGRLGKSERFHVGLGDRSFYQRAVLISKTSTGRSFHIAVPRQRTLSMFIDSDVPVSILDSAGAALEVGRLTSKTIATGAGGPLTINLTLP